MGSGIALGGTAVGFANCHADSAYSLVVYHRLSRLACSVLHWEARIAEHMKMGEYTEVEQPWDPRKSNVLTKMSSFALSEEVRLGLIAKG